jgi:hypothetical protein
MYKEGSRCRTMAIFPCVVVIDEDFLRNEKILLEEWG